jgi:hypothetical protein
VLSSSLNNLYTKYNTYATGIQQIINAVYKILIKTPSNAFLTFIYTHKKKGLRRAPLRIDLTTVYRLLIAMILKYGLARLVPTPSAAT